MTEIRVGTKYRLGHRILSGTKYDTYIGVNVTNGEEVAIRLEPTNQKKTRLLYEAKLWKLFQAPGLAQVYWYGVEGSYNVVVGELLGPSIDEL